jgi:hypothetical protein
LKFRAKWQERGVKKGWRGLLYPLTQNIVVEALRPRILREIRRLRGKPGYSGLPRSAPKKRSP